MSKLLVATCNAQGVVSAEGVTVPAAVVISEGKKASTGVLIIDGELARYLTSNATDIQDLIVRVVAIVEQLTVIATGLDAVSTSPGSVAAAITQLGVLKTQLDATKGTLK